MKLGDWRREKGLSLGALARQAGARDATVVRRWETGGAIPRPATMKRLYELTGGLVDPNSFYDLPILRRRAA